MKKRFFYYFVGALSLLGVCLLLAACGEGQADVKAEAPPPPKVEHESNVNIVKVDHPEQFPLATAAEHQSVSTLTVTGVVNPDVSRNVPVISLASGRVVDIRARLGDQVKKGQLLMRVQSADISTAFSDYQKSVNDERLARTQLERAKILYDKGAIAQKDMEVAEDAEQNAKADLEAKADRLRVLGVNKDHASGSGIVDVVAPVSGVITDQQVTNAAGVQALSGPNPFTISDLSYVWILCDVHENELSNIRLGDYADIHLNAYPDQLLKGRIDNIGAVLDPNIRTAKVRLQVQNSGLLRVGMFATATFYGKKPERRAAVPASAVLHLRDRNWVFMPLADGQFQRVEVTAGEMLPENMQEIISGIVPGQQVAANALVLQNTVEQ
ncbi:MAG TPA: efflux RND transporter periplasmic adaptor subunit [Terriglobales bacterium]|jgi:cobalt-zinc-cadmium efflux system membrane fusion protein|nr:efflux RND transporter periplasmic adaptor subunit [Terriglobales bacterium]